MLRSVAAIVAGYGIMSLTVIGGIILAASLFIPGGVQAVAGGAAPPALPAAYLAANLATGALGAVLGGWLAARVAAFAPLGHAAVLAVIVAVVGVRIGRGRAGGTPARLVPDRHRRDWRRRCPGRRKAACAAADAAAGRGPVVA